MAVGNETNGETVRGTCSSRGCEPVNIIRMVWYSDGELGGLTVIVHGEIIRMVRLSLETSVLEGVPSSN